MMEFNLDNHVLGAQVFVDATEQLLDSVDRLKLDSLVMGLGSKGLGPIQSCFPLLHIISEHPTSPYILALKKLYFVNSKLHQQMWTKYDIETSFMWITTFRGSLIKHLSSLLKWTRSTSKLRHSGRQPRMSGQALEFKQLNVHAWEAFEKGQDIHLQATTSQAELLYKRPGIIRCEVHVIFSLENSIKHLLDFGGLAQPLVLFFSMLSEVGA